MKIKQSKLFWVVLGIVVIVAFVKIYNPIQRVMLQKYFQENYGQSEYKIGYKYFFDVENYNDLSEQLAWNKGFKYPANVFLIEKENSRDSDFYIGIHNFRIMDTYDMDIKRRGNVLNRFERKLSSDLWEFLPELNEVVTEVKSGDLYNLYPHYSITLSPYEENDDISEILQFDMPFDDDIPIKKVFSANTTISASDVNEVVETVKQWNEVFKNHGLSIDEYEAECKDAGGKSVFYTMAVDDIDSDDLVEKLTKQYNQFEQE